MTQRTPLTVAAAQPLTIPHDVAGNAERHAALIDRAGARVVVFPELSLTGYELAADPIDPVDPALLPIVDACRRNGSIALIGAPTADPTGGTNIAMVAGDGRGATIAYRKMNLGGDELDHITPGTDPAVLDIDGWRLGLAICKDTGEPSHAAATAASAAAGLDASGAPGLDAYVAGVLEHEADRHVQPARAARVIAEHAVWVVIASFAGSTGGGFNDAAGRSTIWGPDGTIRAEAGRHPGELAVATLDR